MMQSSASIHTDLLESYKANRDNPAALKEQLIQAWKNGQIKLKDIEKGTSYKASTISQVLNDQYEGDAAKVLDAILRYYKLWVVRNTIIETHVVENIGAAIEMIWRRRIIGMIISKFGKGKSDASLFYAVNHPDFACFVELHGATSPKDMLGKICDALDISDLATGPAQQRLDAIIRNLQRQPKVLIIDEADELHPKSLKLLRDIHGDKQARCGIVLIANDKLSRLLQHPDLGYFESRISFRMHVDDIYFSEAKEIADRYPHDLDSAELKEAFKEAMAHHGIRSFVFLFENALTISQMQDKEKIDGKCMREAYLWLTGWTPKKGGNE